MSKVDLKGKTILVTGAAGFIGSNLVKRLYNDVEDVTVIGIDNMNDYYDVRLKEARLEELSAHPSFVFVKEAFCLNNQQFTEKSRAALSTAQQLTVQYQHQEIMQEHLAYALLLE